LQSAAFDLRDERVIMVRVDALPRVHLHRCALLKRPKRTSSKPCSSRNNRWMNAALVSPGNDQM